MKSRTAPLDFHTKGPLPPGTHCLLKKLFRHCRRRSIEMDNKSKANKQRFWCEWLLKHALRRSISSPLRLRHTVASRFLLA